MIIFVAADHNGFKMKEFVKQELANVGYEVVDRGNKEYDENDDYPDFAARVAREIMVDPENRRGVLICGSGVGMDVTVNKFKDIRSALVFNPDQAYDSRNDDDANVLCLASSYLEPEEAKKILTTWFNTPFSGEERYKRRIRKISEIEAGIRGETGGLKEGEEDEE